MMLVKSSWSSIFSQALSKNGWDLKKIKLQEIRKFEIVDEHLLRSLVGTHAKTPLEFLYLETGTIPIRFILSCRRMIYLQTILKRFNLELTKRIYMKQKQSPTKGDFYCLVVKDFEMIGKTLDETEIMNTSEYSYKKEIKQKIRKAALSYLTLSGTGCQANA